MARAKAASPLSDASPGDPDPRIARTRIAAAALLGALKDVVGACAGRDTIPILGNVLIEAADGRLSLTATDLDLWVTRRLASDESGQADSAEWKARSRGFTLTLPGKVLSLVLGEFDGDAMVTLAAPTDAEPRAVLSAGRARFKLPCLPAAEFPLPPERDSELGFEMRASALGDALAAVEHAISQEETRYYLNGIFLHPEALDLRFVASDGHRLARLAVDMPDGAASFPAVIVAKKSIALLGRLLAQAAKTGEHAQVSLDAGGSPPGALLRFAMDAPDGGGVELVAKAIDGTFPDYQRVIPADPPLRAVIDRAALAQAVKRVGLLAAAKSRIVKACFEEGLLRLSASSAELGEASEELPCDFGGGEPIAIGFDSAYWLDALRAAASERVVLEMTDAQGPCRIVAQASDGSEPGLVQVLMPVRV